MNSVEKKIKNDILQLVDNDLAAFTPGLCLQVVEKGKLKADLALGSTYKYYDLASLTKIIFTVPTFMSLVDQKKINVNDKVSAILDWWPHKAMTLKQVLSHSAQLPWWAPYYKSMDLAQSPEKRRQSLKKMLSQTKKTGEKKSVYSDIDFLLLGFVLEEIFDLSLYEIWHTLSWIEKTPSLHFNVNNKPTYKRELYAPTEKCPWRKKTLQGEVHDDNTWSFGGVSTHSGLFGTINDVTKYGLFLRESYKNKKGGPLATNKTAQLFTKRAIPATKGDWALGYMMPTKGGASCGQHFSLKSFGHTGFTGTSLWYDPKQDLLVTILSNRVHPTRENKKFVKLRPLLHDTICESL